MFLKRRWWRTLPNYYLFLLILTVLALYQGSMSPPRSWVPYLFFLQNFTTPPETFFNVSWSLAVEEWFYLLLPFFVLCSGIFIKNRSTAFLAGVATMAFISFLLRISLFDGFPWDEHARKIAIGRLDAMAWGCFIAWLKELKPAWFERLAHPICATFFLTISLLVSVIAFRNFPSSNTLIHPALLFSALPASFAFCIPFFSKASFSFLPRWMAKVILLISLSSYSLYLCHMPIFNLSRHLTPEEAGLSVQLIFRGAGIVAAFLLSYLLYRYFESPLLRLRPKNPERTIIKSGLPVP